MEELLLSLNQLNDSEKLKNYVENLNISTLHNEISKICLKEEGSFTLQILFRGLSHTPKCEEIRTKISTEVLNNIHKKLISARLASKLISVLASEVENLSTAHLITLTNSCLQMMQNGQDGEGTTCWKELIPKLLNILVEKDTIEYNGTVMSGNEYKSEIVTGICVNEWQGCGIANVASMFSEMPLSSEEHLKVVQKLCKAIGKLKLNEIPSLTHQILHLTKERNSMPLFVALAEFFDSNLYNNISSDPEVSISQTTSEYDVPLKEFQIVEGTTLYHISSGLASGPHSVKDFLKTLTTCIQKPQFVLRPFFITLLLSISQISHTFEQEVLNIFKSAVVRSVAEEEKIIESAWLETIIPEKVDVEGILNKVTQNCFRDRDKILKGLISLAFSLLEVLKTRGKDAQQCEKIWNIGSTLLVNLIQKYPHVTDTVFQNLVNHISQVHESSQYTDTLSKIAAKRPLSLLDSSSVIIQLLGNICTKLPGNVRPRVIAGILPLTKMSPSLRDNLIIFFRKALFSDKSSREMAVYGFLELLKDLRITDIKSLSQSMSQNYVGITQIYSGSFSNTAGTVSNEGMCLEILAILRQVFEYHSCVKITLYKGVYECFYANPKLGTHILDNLKIRLDKYYRGDKETPPLDFQSIVAYQGSTVVIQEPIAHLVFAVAQIAAKIEDDLNGQSRVKEMLDCMCETMSDSDIPHFGFEKEGGFVFEDLPENQVKQERIRQILGVYEALIGYVLCTWKQESLEYGRKLNSLYKGYSRLLDYAKNSNKSEKKKLEDNKKGSQKEFKDKNKFVFKMAPTVLNLKCASRLLSVVSGAPVSWSSEESTELIRGKRDLHRYAFNVTLELISQARLLSPSEFARSKYMLQYISYIGKVLFTKCIKRLTHIKEFDGQCAVLALESFSELLMLVCHHFKPKLSTFLTDIGAMGNDLKAQMKLLIDEITEQLKDILCEENEDNEGKEESQSKKLSLILININSFLINQLPRGGPQLQQVFNKLRSICVETKIQNPNIAKSLLNVLLDTYLKVKPIGSLLIDLVLCICNSMSLIDDEMEIDKHEKFAIVNEKTTSSCLTVVCEAVRFLVGEIEWMISRFKADLCVLPFPTNESFETRQEALEESEREMCKHLNFIIKLLSMICTIAVPPGVLADSVLKEIANIYNKLALVTKYFILKVTKHHQDLKSTRFEKTIKLADHELTKNMYCFTEHIIADGAACTDDPPLKKQKTDAAALRSKVLKKTKNIPKVIYEKEQFQKFVLQLSVKSKVDLELKNTMARDYRLYARQVKDFLEKENINAGEELMEVDDTSQQESTQASKRAKTQE